jgi:Putative peptidoglycan binding domain
MMRATLLSFALTLAACTATAPGPATTDLSSALVAREGGAPPADPEGACWAETTTPAVFETETDQVLDTPERRAPDGTLIAPATFRTETRQALVAERQDFWFQRPCDDELTPDLIATLQRALKARGVYTAAVTGVLDAETKRAIRTWQRPRGLDSDVLALVTAQTLGLLPGVF